MNDGETNKKDVINASVYYFDFEKVSIVTSYIEVAANGPGANVLQ